MAGGIPGLSERSLIERNQSMHQLPRSSRRNNDMEGGVMAEGFFRSEDGVASRQRQFMEPPSTWSGSRLPEDQAINEIAHINFTLPMRQYKEKDVRKDLTTYSTYTISPSMEPHSSDTANKKATWTRALLIEQFFAQDDIAKTIKKLDERESVTRKLRDLGPNQTLQVSNILDSKLMSDRDSQFEWSVAQLDKVYNVDRKGKRTTKSITVYLKRAPKADVDCMEILRRRDAQKVAQKQNAEHQRHMQAMRQADEMQSVREEGSQRQMARLASGYESQQNTATRRRPGNQGMLYVPDSPRDPRLGPPLMTSRLSFYNGRPSIPTINETGKTGAPTWGRDNEYDEDESNERLSSQFHSTAASKPPSPRRRRHLHIPVEDYSEWLDDSKNQPEDRGSVTPRSRPLFGRLSSSAGSSSLLKRLYSQKSTQRPADKQSIETPPSIQEVPFPRYYNTGHNTQPTSDWRIVPLVFQGTRRRTFEQEDFNEILPSAGDLRAYQEAQSHIARIKKALLLRETRRKATLREINTDDDSQLPIQEKEPAGVSAHMSVEDEEDAQLLPLRDNSAPFINIWDVNHSLSPFQQRKEGRSARSRVAKKPRRWTLTPNQRRSMWVRCLREGPLDPQRLAHIIHDQPSPQTLIALRESEDISTERPVSIEEHSKAQMQLIHGSLTTSQSPSLQYQGRDARNSNESKDDSRSAKQSLDANTQEEADRDPFAPAPTARVMTIGPPSRRVPMCTSQPWIIFMTALFGGPGTLCLGGAFFLDLREPGDERRLYKLLHEWLNERSGSNVAEPMGLLPAWVTSDFLYCTSSGFFLVLGVYMTLVPILQHTYRNAQMRMGRWIFLVIASFGSFGLAVASVFTFSKTAPGGSLLGGLGNASQVFVIFMSMLMVNEKESLTMRSNDIPLTELQRDVTS